MGIKTWLVGCSFLCAFGTLQSVAHAEPIGGTRQSEGLQAPAFGQIPSAADATLPAVDNGLNETVIRIPDDDITLQTTVFKPNGAGPFPMIVFNHGKLPGDAHDQPRNRPLALAREFVRHGYVVVVPNRRGFAESGGNYAGNGCNVEANGYAQARDVAATVAYMSEQPYIDKTHIVVGGTSHGGLTAIAYGAQDAASAPGVRGPDQLFRRPASGRVHGLAEKPDQRIRRLRRKSEFAFAVALRRERFRLAGRTLRPDVCRIHRTRRQGADGRLRRVQERRAPAGRRPRRRADLVAASEGVPHANRHADRGAVPGLRAAGAESDRLRESRRGHGGPFPR